MRDSDAIADPAVWARALLRTTLDRWLSAATDHTGLFHPYLNRRWERIAGGPLTLVSQCRLIYNFCRGYEVFGEGAYAEAAQQGLTALYTYFRLAPGRYRWAVTADGGEIDPTPDSYGHAFSILAQATAARVFGDPGLADSAGETWEFIAAACADSRGGLVWRLDGHSDKSPRSQNPLMHLFEALMALHGVDSTGRALTAARNLLAFVRSLPWFERGALVERYTPDWEPLSVERGGVIDLGHQFEWAFLLSEWHGLTAEPDALTLSANFLRTGLAWGLDDDGGVRESCGPDGQAVVSVKGLWQQCEAIRAMHRCAPMSGELPDALHRTLTFYRRHFVDEEYGGVFACPDGLGRRTCLDKGDAWKLDYHTVNMCLELLRERPE